MLCVLDKNMKTIIRTILKDDGTLFSVPIFLGFSTDMGTVYVLDCMNGCYGITIGGQVVLRYQNPEAYTYLGLVVDKDGLFKGSLVEGRCQTEKIYFSSEPHEVYTVFGDSYPLRLVENTLAVFQRDNGTIGFYYLPK